MLKHKKSLSSLLLILALLTTNISVFASEPTYNDKQLFVANILSTTDNQKPINVDSQKNINEVLMKYVSNDISGVLAIINDSSVPMVAASTNINRTSYEILEDYLNANNVYIYSCETSSVINGRSVGSTDVQMSRVIISYNSNNNTWCVTGGGYWITNSYEDDAPSPSILFGARDVGGHDAVGFALINTSGTIPTLISSSGYVHDGNGRSMNLTNPYNSDSSVGLVFQYQDEVYYSNNLQETWYMGYGFAAQGIYSGDFSNYHGKARSYYAHTWEDCAINSIGISKDGFSASWSHSAYGWEIYNNSDVNF